MACRNEDINDILTADEKTDLSTENKIDKEIETDPQNSSDILESYMNTAKISTDQVSNPKSSIVDTDKMDYEDVITMLGQLGIKIGENAGTNRNLLKEKLYGDKCRGPSDEKAKHVVDSAMTKHKAVKRQLVDSYSNCIDITNMDTFKKELQKPLKERFPGFIKQMEDTLETLKKDSSEFEIVVTGETMAGKSTFLNILLGEKILPSNILHTTSCICRLHNSSDKKVSYWDNKENKTVQLTSDNPKEIEDVLDKIIGPKMADDTNTKFLRKVDIYWPIPLLQEDVILVNTPSIGETTLLTKEIVEYVPKADGYIFIIDSLHAGGLQQDKVQFLLNEIKKKQGSEMRDFSNFFFVSNKWDLVQKVKPEEVDRLWEDIWSKLQLICGTLEKWQVIKFSSKLELDLLHLKANHTDAYVNILTGLENILMGAMYKRIGCKLEWIHRFMMEMNNLIDTQINGAESDPSTLLNQALDAKKILDTGSEIVAKETKDVSEQVQTKTTYLEEELRKHLESPEIFKRIGDTLNDTFTDLLLQMETIFSDWIHGGSLRKEYDTMDEKIDKLEKQMKTTLQTIEWFGLKTTFARNEGGFLSRIKSVRGPIPLHAILGLDIGVLVKAVPYSLSMLSNAYLFNPLRSMLTYTTARASIQHLKSVVKTIVQCCFQTPYIEKIMELYTEFECTISFISKTIVKMEKDAQNQRNLSSLLRAFRNKIKDSLRRLQKVNILYGHQNIVPTEQLIIGQILSKTDVFHLYTVKGDFEGKHVTLRVLEPNFSVFYMKEIENIRAMDHENFASHVAMVFSTSTLKELPESMETCDCNDDWLRVLIEPSNEDLETYIFSHKDEIGCVVGESAKATFVQISSGIINGLAYIHSKKFVHGHLELSTVLLCGPSMLPKLCDLNVLPYYKERNHEKCIYHTAPEVLKDGTYCPEADVYSYGILLWELWYGQHTKRNETLHELTVCFGERPNFEDKRPPIGMEKLITMCWAGDPNKRPTAEELRERLLKPDELV